MTLPVSWETYEQTLSALEAPFMKQDRLNNGLLLHCGKSVTNPLNTVDIAKKSVFVNEYCKRHCGSVCALFNDEPPPPRPIYYVFQSAPLPLHLAKSDRQDIDQIHAEIIMLQYLISRFYIIFSRFFLFNQTVFKDRFEVTT